MLIIRLIFLLSNTHVHYIHGGECETKDIVPLLICVKLGCAPITSIFLCDENVEGIILIDIWF